MTNTWVTCTMCNDRCELSCFLSHKSRFCCHTKACPLHKRWVVEWVDGKWLCPARATVDSEEEETTATAAADRRRSPSRRRRNSAVEESRYATTSRPWPSYGSVEEETTVRLPDAHVPYISRRRGAPALEFVYCCTEDADGSLVDGHGHYQGEDSRRSGSRSRSSSRSRPRSGSRGTRRSYGDDGGCHSRDSYYYPHDTDASDCCQFDYDADFAQASGRGFDPNADYGPRYPPYSSTLSE
ncbi:hypothetical protein B0T17DRAFT_511575 [Bombardia bombarda]|uniref:Uncharacterized protein n=1 Tax=Bombardia bombarda TaxID=252184 RepID=A0AA39TTW7_9PEZI|nr:hypothetical protein B0T17DRAFT_511575 [Bombardia bombarda]